MFHPLHVRTVERLTDDSAALTLDVPPELRATYAYAPGQHIALRRTNARGEEVRRTYSLCDPADSAPETLRVGVRLVEGGEFSTYALKELTEGGTVEVLPPTGRFILAPRAGRFAAVVGGSGITPVLSIAATLLKREPEARFCLIRSDRTTASTMFLEEVADLKDRYPDRFQLVTVLSREEQHSGLASGRLDEERLTALLPSLLSASGIPAMDGWYLCGPLGLVESASKALRSLGVPRSRIHQEIFHAGTGTGTAISTGAGGGTVIGAGSGTGTTPGTGTGMGAGAGPATAVSTGPVTVSATLAGRGGTWPMDDGESVLETVLRNRADAPYACKGGVCGTCRVRLLSGEVQMDRNYALEPEELDAGYVLACQSHPLTPKVKVDFDAGAGARGEGGGEGTQRGAWGRRRRSAGDPQGNRTRHGPGHSQRTSTVTRTRHPATGTGTRHPAPAPTLSARTPVRIPDQGTARALPREHAAVHIHRVYPLLEQIRGDLGRAPADPADDIHPLAFTEALGQLALAGDELAHRNVQRVLGVPGRPLVVLADVQQQRSGRQRPATSVCGTSCPGRAFIPAPPFP